MIKVFILVLIAIFFTACSNDDKIIPSGKKINISILAPLSGDNKRYGRQSLLGMTKANDMKRYLHNGDEIALHVADTKTIKKFFVKALNSANENKNKVIVTFEGSNNLIEVKDELKQVKIPIIATLATNNEITSLSDNMIQICMDNDMEALVAAHFTKDEKLMHSVGIVYDKTNKYSSELAHEFKILYTRLGGKVKFYDDVSTSSGFKKFKHRNKNNIDLLFSVANAKDSVQVITLIKKQNEKIEILSTDGLLNNALENERDNLELFNGIYVVENYAHTNPHTYEHKALKKYLLKYDLEESSYAYLAYDAYQLLYYALDICVDYNEQCISAAMKNSDVIEGIKGNFSIINSKAKREVYVDKIMDSKLIKEIVIY